MKGGALAAETDPKAPTLAKVLKVPYCSNLGKYSGLSKEQTITKRNLITFQGSKYLIHNHILRKKFAS